MYRYSGTAEYFHTANTNLKNEADVDQNKILEVADAIDFIVAKEKHGANFSSFMSVVEAVNVLINQYNSVLAEIYQLSSRYMDAATEAEREEIQTQLQNDISTQLENTENELDIQLEDLNSFKEYFNDGIKVLIWADVYYDNEVQNTNTKIEELLETIQRIRNTIDNLSSLCTADEIPAPINDNPISVAFEGEGCITLGPCTYSTMDIISSPSSELFSGMKTHYDWFRLHLSSSSRFSSFSNWLHKANTRSSLTRRAGKGFFNLPVDLVNYLIDSGQIEWGGNWNSIKDFMHFEAK